MLKTLKRVLASVVVLTCLLGVCATKSATTLKSVKVSWYGKNFQGRRMANGKPYDMYAMTAAHKTLPLGTCVLVKNETAEVVLLISDRGPYIKGRSLDVSYAAARLLGIIGKGTGEVSIQVLGRVNDDNSRCDSFANDTTPRESGCGEPSLQPSESVGQGLCDFGGLSRNRLFHHKRS